VRQCFELPHGVQQKTNNKQGKCVFDDIFNSAFATILLLESRRPCKKICRIRRLFAVNHSCFRMSNTTEIEDLRTTLFLACGSSESAEAENRSRPTVNSSHVRSQQCR